jgi:hypothetical protein
VNVGFEFRLFSAFPKCFSCYFSLTEIVSLDLQPKTASSVPLIYGVKFFKEFHIELIDVIKASRKSCYMVPLISVAFNCQNLANLHNN